MKTGHQGATRKAWSGKLLDISSFRLDHTPQALAVAGSATTQAYVVPMMNYSSGVYGCHNLNGSVGAMPHYLLYATGDGVMVTGELSGCCFAWEVQGANLLCARVQPRDGIDGDGLQIELRHGGRFAAGGGPVNTFGNKEYPGAQASVIGVRIGGVWSLYAQTSLDYFRTISGAFRLHPGRREAL